MTLEYPGWAMAMIVMLIVFASLPVPIGYARAWLKRRHSHEIREAGGGQEMHRQLYTKCNSAELLDPDSPRPAPADGEATHPRPVFLPIGSEQYRLLPQQEDEDEEEDDTGV